MEEKERFKAKTPQFQSLMDLLEGTDQTRADAMVLLTRKYKGRTGDATSEDLVLFAITEALNNVILVLECVVGYLDNMKQQAEFFNKLISSRSDGPVN